MRWLKRRERETQTVREGETPECAHITMVPRWNSVGDIGHEDRASRYQCESCGTELTTDEALRLKGTEKERLQRRLAS